MDCSVCRWLLLGAAAVLCCEPHVVYADTVHRKDQSRHVDSSALSTDTVEAFWTSHRSPPLVRSHQLQREGPEAITSLAEPTVSPEDETDFGEVLSAKDFRRSAEDMEQALFEDEKFADMNDTDDGNNSQVDDAIGANATNGSASGDGSGGGSGSGSGGGSGGGSGSGSGSGVVVGSGGISGSGSGDNDVDVNETVETDDPAPVADGPLAAQDPVLPGRSPTMDEPQRPAIGQSQPAGGNESYGEFSGVVHYNIMCVASGLYLREDPANEAKFRLKCETLDSDDPSFRFRFVAETDGRWRIRATSSHHYLWEYTVDNEVRGTESVADEYTSFSMEPQADWSYKMKVRANNHYLYQDSTTNILAGGDITDEYANFKLVPLESAAPCKAYQFQAVCPPNRCWWMTDHCEFELPDDIQNGVTHSSSCVVLAVFALTMLMYV